MSEAAGEKTEQPTQRKLEDAQKQGNIPRSPEVQTVFVLLGATAGLVFTGHETWGLLIGSLNATLGHLHDTPISANLMQSYAISWVWLVMRCAGPIVLGCLVAGLLAGGIQTRFNTSSEALSINWERLNPVDGLKRVFSMRSAVPAAIGLVKLAAVVALSYSTVMGILSDPIFTSSVSLDRIGAFMADSVLKILTRLILIMGVIAAADYTDQFWRTSRDLMMTHDEIKEETKSQEGNQQVKTGRARLRRHSKRRMLADVPTADVIVTNPTHIAVALRYDPKTMKAPKIVAKGIRKNAEQIKAIALAHHIPIQENKPLARLMFKHGKVGGEVPAQLYVAVAEVLAWVYRVNRYRYYAQANTAAPTQ